MSYKVIYRFRDLKDPEGHVYSVGEKFPREGVEASKARLQELASKNNKLKRPIIELVEEAKPKEEAPEEKVKEAEEEKKSEAKPKKSRAKKKKKDEE